MADGGPPRSRDRASGCRLLREEVVSDDRKRVIDTTANQFGGLRVYVGPLQDPWSMSVVPIPRTKLARLPKKL